MKSLSRNVEILTWFQWRTRPKLFNLLVMFSHFFSFYKYLFFWRLHVTGTLNGMVKLASLKGVYYAFWKGVSDRHLYLGCVFIKQCTIFFSFLAKYTSLTTDKIILIFASSSVWAFSFSKLSQMYQAWPDAYMHTSKCEFVVGVAVMGWPTSTP